MGQNTTQKPIVTTSYFNLEIVARQCDPVSAYLFILFYEVLLLPVKANDKTNGLNIFQYLYTVYADDTTFLLKIKNSIRQLMETCSTFSPYSCLKSNPEKCEIARIGVLKSVKVAVWYEMC